VELRHHYFTRLPKPQRSLDGFPRFYLDSSPSNGIPDEREWQLPLATRLVAGRNGGVVSVEADPDHTIRPEPAATLEVLKTMYSEDVI
jgi:hypothetical protein